MTGLSVFYDSYHDVATLRMERGEQQGVRWRLRRWTRRAAAVAVSAGAIGMLVLLYDKTQSTGAGSISAESALRRIHQLDSDWNVAVMSAKVGLFEDYDPLVALPRRIGDGLQLLKGRNDAGDPGVAAQLAQLRASLDRKADLIEAFKSHNSILRNSLRYLPSAADAAMSGSAGLPQAGELRARIDRTLEEALKFAAVPEIAQRERLEEEIAGVVVLLDAAHLPEPARESGRLFVNHARTVLREMAEETRLLSQVLEVPMVPAIQKASTAYSTFHAGMARESDDWRKALVAYSALLLALVGYTAWRLRQSYRQIRGMNDALVEANTSLEDRVRERTEELRRTLETLHESERQLIQSEKMSSLGQMVAGIVHEINTPLAYVRSNIEIVGEELPSEELRQLTTDSLYGLDQISEIVMNLKNFSRLDRSKATPFDLREGLESTLVIARSTLKGRHVVRDFGDIPRITCAPSQLNQVFLNLITNAAQALPDQGGEITIATRSEGSWVSVSIADNGCGIPRENLTRIFDPFFTTKEIGKGTGLGLSIAYKIVQEHGGTIEVDSAPGAGTVFTIRLPLAREEALA